MKWRLLFVAAILAVLAWLAVRWTQSRRAPAAPAAVVDTTSTGFRAVQLYFASPGADSLVAEPRELVEPATLRDRVASLVRELDRGPAHGGVAVLPAGTSVRFAYLDPDGLLTVDLSRSFVQEFHGGAGAEYLAVASLVRTLAANLAGVKRVLLVCGGEPLATLGGHVPLDRPLEVSDFP
jgi:sporulation and spore germination protein